MSKILVTGGAGYIGSHTVRHLIGAGFDVTVIDNLYSGFRWAVDAAAEFVEADIGDYPLVCELMNDCRFDAVIHFAGHVVVFESVDDPLKYYRNNTVNSQRLIQACLHCGVSRFLFSSTCSVYGESNGEPIAEDTPVESDNRIEFAVQHLNESPVESGGPPVVGETRCRKNLQVKTVRVIALPFGREYGHFVATCAHGTRNADQIAGQSAERRIFEQTEGDSHD